MKIKKELKELIQNIEWTTPALKIKGKTILTPDFIELCLKLETGVAIAKKLGCDSSNISGQIKRNLPELYAQWNKTLLAKILFLIEHKRCSKCKELKPFNDFSKNQHSCKSCYKAYYEDNEEAIRANVKVYRKKHKEKYAAYNKVYRKEHKEEIAKKSKDYYETNKEKVRAVQQVYLQTKRAKALRNAAEAKRNAAKLQRTPFWSETEDIKNFYVEKVEGYEIDHWAPLQGKKVSGLHVISNLQYLTPYENQSKSNKFDPEHPPSYRSFEVKQNG